MQDSFRLLDGTTLPLPLFFPDATRGFVRELSWEDVKKVGLPGVLVNTFHLLREQGYEKTRVVGGVRPMIGWEGAIISDSGGFQVMSIAKKGSGRITDEGVVFVLDGVEHLLTPEDSIRYQLTMKTDLCVVLDDFTPPDATYEEAEETVVRTTLWARRCKEEYERIVKEWAGRSRRETRAGRPRRETRAGRPRPYVVGVVQGGAYSDLRMRSIKELTEIGFDGYGYGGWPIKDGVFDVATAELIAREINNKFNNLAGRHGREDTGGINGREDPAGRHGREDPAGRHGREDPAPTLLYGLGIGKPDDIVKCVDLGWQIFDCVLPTRDARHGRLYVYTAESMDKIDVHSPTFYEYYNPTQASHKAENVPVSTACDCELCTTKSRSELYAMWKAKDRAVLRLATIHNLRFYAVLMEKLRS